MCRPKGLKFNSEVIPNFTFSDMNSPLSQAMKSFNEWSENSRRKTKLNSVNNNLNSFLSIKDSTAWNQSIVQTFNSSKICNNIVDSKVKKSEDLWTNTNKSNYLVYRIRSHLKNNERWRFIQINKKYFAKLLENNLNNSWVKWRVVLSRNTDSTCKPS